SIVDVVKENLRNASPAPGHLSTEVDEPPIVGFETSPSALVLISGAWRCRGQGPGWKEGRRGVGKKDLADDAIRLEVFQTGLTVPVRRDDSVDGAGSPGTAVGLTIGRPVVDGLFESQPGVSVRSRPDVKFGMPTRLQVGLVIENIRTCVAI